MSDSRVEGHPSSRKGPAAIAPPLARCSFEYVSLPRPGSLFLSKVGVKLRDPKLEFLTAFPPARARDTPPNKTTCPLRYPKAGRRFNSGLSETDPGPFPGARREI